MPVRATYDGHRYNYQLWLSNTRDDSTEKWP
jgi:hypothetical protein